MKQTKKLFSVVLAIVLAFAMMIPAFAADQEGTITIKGTTDYPVTGRTFNAYKILDAKAVNVENVNDGIVYSVPDAMKGFYADYFNAATEGEDDPVDANENIDDVVAAINALKDDTDALQAFAKAALAYAKDKGVAAVTSVIDGEVAKIADAPFGYYVIEDATTVGKDNVVSALMLETTTLDVTIKADKPALEKKIDGDKDNDSTTTGLVDYNVAAVGEKVPYVLTSKVPSMVGYETYTYKVTDTFSTGLTFNDDVTITIGNKTLVKDTDFTVTKSTDGQTVTIEFVNFIQYKENAGADITINYTATVDTDAVFGVEGNPNTANLTYSNNPQVEDSTTSTPNDEVLTYLVDLIINKTDGNDQPLAGATFALKSGDTLLAQGTSGADGKVTFVWEETADRGLKENVTYTITETVVPAGYNKAADIEFTVTCTDPKNGTDCEWTATSDDAEITFTANEVTDNANKADTFETTIKNLTGALLPETGGMGTTMFYIIGAMMVIGAAVIMISKKRMAFEA